MATTIEPELRLPDLKADDVPVVSPVQVEANWRNMGNEPSIALGTILRSILLAAAVRDDAFRKRWCDAEGEPGPIAIEAAATLPFKFAGRKDIAERVHRLAHRCALIGRGKARNPAMTTLTPELEAQLEAEYERLSAIAEGPDLDWESLGRLWASPSDVVTP